MGEDFRIGKLFVPQVLMAAKVMKAGMEIWRPLLAETGAPRIGTLVIGTVKGDIHDIGKNLVGMMMEGAGFQVVNLGINTDVEKFLHAVREHAADILGMSALLTTTCPTCGRHTGAEGIGLREKLIVLVGGAPLNADFAKQIGADAYCRDAAKAVETAKRLMAEKIGARLSDGGRWRALLAAPGPILADGAMGTMLFEAGLTSGTRPSAGTSSGGRHPRGPSRLPRRRLAHLLTNTFGGNRFASPSTGSTRGSPSSTRPRPGWPARSRTRPAARRWSPATSGRAAGSWRPSATSSATTP